MAEPAEEIATFDDARAAVAGGLDVGDAAAALVAAMTPEERRWCLDGDSPTWAGLGFMATGGYHRAPFRAARVERVGLGGVAFSDGPRGVVIGNATCFPVTMARGATWDPELEEQVGEAIGRELAATGANLYGGVCVNLIRHPGWGRAQETYGEDPHHVGEMGAALTRGIQRHAMACVKHFACNSIENSRFRVDVDVDEVALHEVYLPHFRRVVDEGVAAVMSAYNFVGGTCCGEHRGLLTGVLREEWGFEGFVISDWIFGLRDAGRSVAAGLDIEMPYRMVRATHLEEDLAAGVVTDEQVDAAATRVVATLLRFDDVLAAPPPPPEVIAGPAHRALARTVAARSVVLLRNEPVAGSPVLPLEPAGGAVVAVVGRLSDEVNLGDGGSSDVWALDAVTVRAGLDAVDGLEVRHDDGADPVRAAALAAAADVAVVVVGCTHEDEGEFIGDPGVDLGGLFPAADDPELVARFEAEVAALPEVQVPPHVAGRPGPGFSEGGDRRSLRLPPADVALIGAVAASNPRTVVVIQGGSAVLIDEWDRSVPAVLQAFYGGSEAGAGLADVLVGAVNPSARLPFTVAAREDHYPPFDPDADTATYDRWHGWWRLERDGHRPHHPFGFGLSYTRCSLGPPGAVASDDGVVFTVPVANVGDRDGAEVVGVYATLPDPADPPRLVGFGRVEVPAGGEAEVVVDVPWDRLERRDPRRHDWVPARGRVVFTVARHVGDPGAHRIEVER